MITNYFREQILKFQPLVVHHIGKIYYFRTYINYNTIISMDSTKEPTTEKLSKKAIGEKLEREFGQYMQDKLGYK